MRSWILIALATMLAAGGLAAASAHAIQPLAHATVIGGTPGNIPELVEIVDDTASTMCSGTIVSPTVVLTAAHCLSGPASGYIVYSNVLGNGLGTVTKVTADPGYTAAPLYQYDAAVLVLATPTSLPSIQLASSQPPAETPAIVYGWGDTSPNRGLGNNPTSGPTVIQPDSYCIAAVGSDYWGPSDMCAQDHPADNTAIGFGDSGGPLIAEGLEVGINDRTYENGSDPSIFTRVDMLRAWIESDIAANPVPPPVWAKPKAKPKPAGDIKPASKPVGDYTSNGRFPSGRIRVAHRRRKAKR